MACFSSALLESLLMKHRRWFLLAISFFAGCSSSSPSIFQKPESSLVLTQRAVVNDKWPVLAVMHFAENDQWAFLADVNPIVDIQVTVTLDDILKFDESLKILSDLPPGWKATRESKDKPWTRQKI
jgi:hypothetical protein